MSENVDTRATMPPPTQNTLHPSVSRSPSPKLWISAPRCAGGTGPGGGVGCPQRKQRRPAVSVGGQCLHDPWDRPSYSLTVKDLFMSSPASFEFDAVIVGGTPAGIMAGITVAKSGAARRYTGAQRAYRRLASERARRHRYPYPRRHRRLVPRIREAHQAAIQRKHTARIRSR